MAKDILHVVPHDEAWAVRREGNERVSSTHQTQKDAIEAAREMAKERDDIVVHRPDGTIRERVTYFGEGESTGGNGGRRAETRTEARDGRGPELRDLVGVGSRVSWGSVLAGVAVAMTTYVVLSLLALAVGLSTADQLRGRNFSVAAAVTAAIILLLSMFLGGLVASRFTAGEQRREAAIYGILVWGATFVLLAAGGIRLAGATADAAVTTERLRQGAGLTEAQAQEVQKVLGETRPISTDDAKQAAWWTFGAAALSLLAAIGGALAGAGPEFLARRAPGPAGTVVAPSPA
jgi:hypothetical protein